MQWIIDALLCNAVGIWCGILTRHYLETRAYHCRGLWKLWELGNLFEQYCLVTLLID